MADTAHTTNPSAFHTPQEFRRKLREAVKFLIDALDQIDGDPDFEPDADDEDDGHAEATAPEREGLGFVAAGPDDAEEDNEDCEHDGREPDEEDREHDGCEPEDYR